MSGSIADASHTVVLCLQSARKCCDWLQAVWRFMPLVSSLFHSTVAVQSSFPTSGSFVVSHKDGKCVKYVFSFLLFLSIL